MKTPIPRRGAQKATRTWQATLGHYLDHHRRESRDSFLRLAKAPVSTFLTVMVMTIALILPLALGLMLQDARDVARSWDGEARLSIYLKPTLDAATQQALLKKAQGLPDVLSVTLITPDAALEDFKTVSGYGQALELFDTNPLPPVLEVFPVRDGGTERLTALRDTLAAWPEVELAELDLAWVQRLQAILDIGTRLLWALGGAMVLGGLLVIGNTIRLSIEARRDEIRVIALLGATKAFVRRPFIYMGVWCGLSAGLFTLLTVVALFSWLNVPVQQLSALYGSDFVLSLPTLSQASLLLLGTGFLGWLGAWVTVARHLRASNPR